MIMCSLVPKDGNPAVICSRTRDRDDPMKPVFLTLCQECLDLYKTFRPGHVENLMSLEEFQTLEVLES